MKKIKLVILLIILNNGISYSQNTFYDAVKLKSIFLVGDDLLRNGDTILISLPDVNEVYSTLKKYVGVTSNSKDSIQKAFETNPFLGFDKQASFGAFGGSGSNPLSSIAGLDVTKFANAIADIMIERAKQELTLAFFNRFKKFSKKYPEFKILFPKTTDNLSNLFTYTYPQMLPALRKGFFEDLEKITYHLDDVLELPKYRHLLNNFPQVSLAIRSIRLIHELESKTSTAADIIKKLAAFKEWNKNGNADFKNMGNTLKFASIFSEGLRYKDTSRIWVSTDEIKELITNDTLAKIYMGLMYQEIKRDDIKFYFNPQNLADTTNLTDIIWQNKDNILLFQNKIAEFINLTDKVMDSYTEIKTKKSDKQKITNEDIYNYINVSIDVIDYAFSIVKILNENLVTDQYLNLAKKSNSLYKDIYGQQYTQAVNDAIDILMAVHDLTEANTSTVTIRRTGIALDKKQALDTLINFVKKVKPYALFMANMVEAKDEAAVKAALENVILPVGSSSIKKNTLCNVSVQTYLGAYFSATNGSSSSVGAWSDKFGVTAPIGVSFTPGFLSWKKAGSLSLFGALFDLGAIVDYKLKQDSATGPISKDYKVKLGNIFSPGIYAVYGFPWDLPLSLGFGAQYGPGLSKIDGQGKTVVGNPAWRCNFFLAVDLTFFTLTNKTKDK